MRVLLIAATPELSVLVDCAACDAGWTVAHCAPDAVEQSSRESPDVVIVECQGSAGAVEALAARVRAATGRTRVVVACDQPAAAHGHEHRTADEFIPLDASPEQLIGAIDRR